ncbi:hypothetical protein F5Y18DRAFT_106692 [Xylariaceae sp. FL1019]|nr:hypothetical protein F5Y18DRAFT_106692 [Xylariaceae sp. FL1019]
MRRLPSLLLAWTSLRLPLSHARQPGFSVHHDLLAYPQFEVVFSESYISESDAQALLDKEDSSRPSYHASPTGQTDISAAIQAAGADPDRDVAPRSLQESYEVMTRPPHRYLCAIPVIEPPPAPNKTATELAKAEEARELARASAHGTDLINQLDGTCLYYMSGWWSYRFCYGQDVVQFHAVTSSVKGGPPTRDANTAEYVLGRIPDPNAPSSRSTRRTQQRNQQTEHDPSTDAGAAPAGTTSAPTTELQVKGDQRYLVQKMTDGTTCDLTMRERTIEVQYHCSPGSTQDRIGWIKEVTTCSYLMLINTPRLCSDVAFRPPKEERANIISCRAILNEEGQAEWHLQKTLEAQAAMVRDTKQAAKGPIVIGGVVVGGRQMLGKGEDGKEAPKLAPPGNSLGGAVNQLVEIIGSAAAKDEGGEIQMMTEDELAALQLSPEIVEELKKELQSLAGDRGWELRLVEVPGNAGARELLGLVAGKDGEDEDAKEGEGGADAKGEGSEEQFYKEEL